MGLTLPRFIVQATRGRRSFVLLTVSSFILNLASLVGSILSLRWIPPTSMGVWQIITVSMIYFNFIRFGIINGMNREIPYRLGRGENEIISQLAETTQLHSLACSFVSGSFYLIWMVFYWKQGVDWRLGLAAIAFSSSLSFYNDYVLACFRSDRNFEKLSYIQFIQAVIALATPLFTYFYGFAGYCVEAVFQTMVLTVMAHHWRPFHVPPRFHREALKILIFTGLPLWITNYIYSTAQGFDRIILLHRTNVKTVGYYTLAAMALSGMNSLPSAISTFIYPKLSFLYGETDNRNSLWRTTLIAMEVSFIECIPIVLAGWLLLPWFVAFAFPKYLPGLGAMRIALLSGMFASVSSGTIVLGSLKAYRWLYLFCALSALARIIFPLYFSQGSDPLRGTAIGVCVASAFIGVLSVFVSYKATHFKKEKAS